MMARPWQLPPDWPEPAPEARAHSEHLAGLIRSEADETGLSFARYMDLALYAPGLGYYSAGARKFGEAGDFVTAPEITPLFARALARTCEAALAALGGGDLLELGAGSGRLAADLLDALAERDCLPGRYLILEPSAELRERQRRLFEERASAWAGRVQWLDALPPDGGFTGLLIANEVLDARPVELFEWRADALLQGRVAWREDGFVLDYERAPGTPLEERVRALAADLDLPEGYRSEIDLGLDAWLASLAAPIARGAMVFIDYGYGRAEYYHPQRAGGTLMCHYRHRAHGDPLLLPGLQDITHYVDFTAVAEAAQAAGLAVRGYCTQAHFLLDNGIDGLLAEAASPEEGARYLAAVQALKTLMLPGEMGERFKCMLLARGLDAPLPGFRSQDLRSRL